MHIHSIKKSKKTTKNILKCTQWKYPRYYIATLDMHIPFRIKNISISKLKTINEIIFLSFKAKVQIIINK